MRIWQRKLIQRLKNSNGISLFSFLSLSLSFSLFFLSLSLSLSLSIFILIFFYFSLLSSCFNPYMSIYVKEVNKMMQTKFGFFFFPSFLFPLDTNSSCPLSPLSSLSLSSLSSLSFLLSPLSSLSFLLSPLSSIRWNYGGRNMGYWRKRKKQSSCFLPGF